MFITYIMHKNLLHFIKHLLVFIENSVMSSKITKGGVDSSITQHL